MYQEDEMFASIVESMGIVEYDDLAISAIKEHIRKFTIKLLFESKEISRAAHHNDIELEDAKIAMSLNEGELLKVENRVKFIHELQNEINSKELPIPSLPISYSELSQMNNAPDYFLQRTYTICSRTEALETNSPTVEHQQPRNASRPIEQPHSNQSIARRKGKLQSVPGFTEEEN